MNIPELSQDSPTLVPFFGEPVPGNYQQEENGKEPADWTDPVLAFDAFDAFDELRQAVATLQKSIEDLYSKDVVHDRHVSRLAAKVNKLCVRTNRRISELEAKMETGVFKQKRPLVSSFSLDKSKYNQEGGYSCEIIGDLLKQCLPEQEGEEYFQESDLLDDEEMADTKEPDHQPGNDDQLVELEYDPLTDESLDDNIAISLHKFMNEVVDKVNAAIKHNALKNKQFFDEKVRELAGQ